MERKYTKHRPAFSVLDSVLALFVVTVMIMIYGGLISVREINRRTLFRAQAAALADEEINALRQLGYAPLADQVNGPFQNVLYNAGDWTVAGGQLELAGNSSITTTSGRLLFPADTYDSGTFETDLKIVAGSPPDSAVGLLFLASDQKNGYRLRLGLAGADLDGGGHNLVLEKIVAGAAATLLAEDATVAVNADTVYNLKIILSDATPTIKIYINDNQQDLNNLSDAAFTDGAVALLGWGGVHAFFDNVDEVDSAACGANPVKCWDFDGVTELPAAWIRLGINDFPDGTPNTFDDNGRLTIADYSAVSPNLKQVTVRVEWLSNGVVTDYTSTILIGKSTLGL